MKRLIIISLVLFSLAAKAQLEIPLSNRFSNQVIADTVIIVSVFPKNTGQNDEFLFLDRTFPSFVSANGFVTMEDVDNAWHGRFDSIEKSASITDTTWVYDNTKYFGLLKNRYGFVLCMKGRQLARVQQEKTTTEKLHWLYWQSIKLGYPVGVYVNYPQVVDLLNEYYGVGEPVTPQDSIQ